MKLSMNMQSNFGSDDDYENSPSLSMTYNDPVEWVKENEAYCFDNSKFAMRYVDAIIQMAQTNFAPTRSFRVSDIITPIIHQIVDEAVNVSNQSKCRLIPLISHPLVTKNFSNSFFGWPSISEFNINLGAERLEQYIKSWQRSDEWLLYVEFLGFESEETANHFVYEVEFSIPTPTYPIPQVTASVYFAMEVSKMVPAQYDRAVDVRYVFEGGKVVHCPGCVSFQEQWIRDIIRCKTRICQSITF